MPKFAATPDGSINLMDKDSILEAMGLSQKKTNKKVLELAHLARAKWIRVAKTSLHTSLREYQNAIQVVQRGQDGSANVDLVGGFPHRIEWGGSAYDMRKYAFNLRGGKGTIKDGPNGRYRVIPFRVSFGGSGMSIPLAGAAYAKKYNPEIAEKLRREAAALLKRLEKPTKGGKVSVQMMRKDGRMQTVVRGASIPANAGGIPLKSHHSAGLFAGIQHFKTAGSKDNQFKMFRTISEGVGAGTSWMYPETKGRKLLDQVQEYIAGIAKDFLVELIEK